MALTLIVQGSSIPSVPSFPSICRGCNNVSCTWWEGKILIYSWAFQVSLSAFEIFFDRRKAKHGSQWGIPHCPATKRDPGDPLGLGGRAPATPFLPAWGGFGSSGTSQTLQVQQLLSVAWKLVNKLQQDPNLILLQDGVGKCKPEPIGPNPKGTLLFSFLFFF